MNIMTNKVSYADLPRHMSKAVKLNHNLFIWGASGIGKTAIVEDFCKGKGYDFIDLFLVTRESIDVSGLPYVTEDGRQAFAAPTLIPLEGDDCPEITVVFLDEINLCAPMTMSAAMKLTNERMAGDRKVHPNVRFFSAANRMKDMGNTGKIPAPLLNRFCHVELNFHDVEGYLEWFTSNGGHPAVYSYLKDNPSKIHAQFNESDYKDYVKNNAFHSHRQWWLAQESLKACEEDGDDISFVRSVLSSHLGMGISMEFMTFYENVAKYPSPSEIFSGKAKLEESIDHSAQYYLSYNILSTMSQRFCSVPSDNSRARSILKDPTYADDMNNAFIFVENNFSAETISAFLTTMLQKFKLPFDPMKMKSLMPYLAPGTPLHDFLNAA